jgi:site-specific recombinase XerD
MKEPVRLRRKKLSDGSESLYLDCYSDGKRSYEFLKLYLLPGTDRETKRRNDETLSLANTMKARRVVELQTRRAGFGLDGRNVLLLDFFKECAEKRTATTRRSWRNCLVYLTRFIGSKRVSLADVDARFLEQFANALTSSELHASSASVYYSVLIGCLHDAERLELIARVPKGVKAPKGEQSTRCFLSLDELQAMIGTRCGNSELKRAFIFSALTGLRISDIRKLRPADVHRNQDGTAKIEVRQKKTGGLLWLDVPADAVALLSLEDDSAPCFLLPSDNAILYDLDKWAAAAGVKKHVTFHVARHTFATLMLNQGTDIYTVSKLLGHSSIKTTQIYAKVVDETKREALSRLSKLVNPSQTSNKNGLKSNKNEVESPLDEINPKRTKD